MRADFVRIFVLPVAGQRTKHPFFSGKVKKQDLYYLIMYQIRMTRIVIPNGLYVNGETQEKKRIVQC
jgi:hypothetical protein